MTFKEPCPFDFCHRLYRLQLSDDFQIVFFPRKLPASFSYLEKPMEQLIDLVTGLAFYTYERFTLGMGYLISTYKNRS